MLKTERHVTRLDYTIDEFCRIYPGRIGYVYPGGESYYIDSNLQEVNRIELKDGFLYAETSMAELAGKGYAHSSILYDVEAYEKAVEAFNATSGQENRPAIPFATNFEITPKYLEKNKQGFYLVDCFEDSSQYFLTLDTAVIYAVKEIEAGAEDFEVHQIEGSEYNDIVILESVRELLDDPVEAVELTRYENAGSKDYDTFRNYENYESAAKTEEGILQDLDDSGVELDEFESVTPEWFIRHKQTGIRLKDLHEEAEVRLIEREWDWLKNLIDRLEPDSQEKRDILKSIKRFGEINLNELEYR